MTERPLAGRVALVTGGSRGIGRATCLALAEAGADLLLTATSRPEARDETAAACRELGVRAVAWSADLTEAAYISAAVLHVDGGLAA